MAKFGHRQANMVLAVVFQQYDNIPTIQNHPVRVREDYRDALLEGFDKFLSEHPQRSMIGLKIAFDQLE